MSVREIFVRKRRESSGILPCVFPDQRSDRPTARPDHTEDSVVADPPDRPYNFRLPFRRRPEPAASAGSLRRPRTLHPALGPDRPFSQSRPTPRGVRPIHPRAAAGVVRDIPTTPPRAHRTARPTPDERHCDDPDDDPKAD